MNVRYFVKLHAWYSAGARWAALLAAVPACASLAQLKLWERHPAVWVGITALAAAVGIVCAVFNLPKESGTLAELQIQWIASQRRWDLAWAAAHSAAANVATVKKLHEADADLESKASSFPTWNWLVNLAQHEACDVLGIERRKSK